MSNTLDIEKQEDSVIDSEKLNEESIPDRLCPEWSDWLLTQFHKSELYVDRENKKAVYPRVHGLRRLAQLFVGRIMESKCHCVQPPILVNNQLTICTFQYEIKFYTDDGSIIVYNDVADVSQLNCTDDNFNIFPSSLAATRAEARVLRKALGLSVCSAEEIQGIKKKPATTEKAVNTDEKPTGKINAAQISFIKKNAKFLNVNPLYILNEEKIKCNSIEDISYAQALTICKTLSEWATDNEKMTKFFKNKNIENPKTYTDNWFNEVL